MSGQARVVVLEVQRGNRVYEVIRDLSNWELAGVSFHLFLVVLRLGPAACSVLQQLS